MGKRMNILSITQLSILLFVQLMTMDLKAQTFSNPISDLADPHITFYNGNYYLTGTTGTNITIRKAATLNALKFAPVDLVVTSGHLSCIASMTSGMSITLRATRQM